MKKFLIVFFILAGLANGSDHGIYLKVLEDISLPVEKVVVQVRQNLQTAGYAILAEKEISGPDRIRAAGEQKCGFRGFVLVLQDTEYTRFLSSLANKYVAAAFLKVGIYETAQGVQVNIADPETITRIVLNDLDDAPYKKALTTILPFKSKLINAIQGSAFGKKVQKAQEPVRSAEDLREAAKDMFMMVGPMTFFTDEDQFPVIYSEKTDKPKAGIQKLIARIRENLRSFEPSEEDREYQQTPKKADLNWAISGMLFSPDSGAALLGISRSRTEALSFLIAGGPRADKQNNCPGLDHGCAYPVEVLIYADNGKIKMRTAREMFRMDMYFWDAGKMAFMKYMNMPKMLDNSIKKALLGSN